MNKELLKNLIQSKVDLLVRYANRSFMFYNTDLADYVKCGISGNHMILNIDLPSNSFKKQDEITDHLNEEENADYFLNDEEICELLKSIAVWYMGKDIKSGKDAQNTKETKKEP